MSLELEDMQQQVDKMSDEELAQLAMRMMAVGTQDVKADPISCCGRCASDAFEALSVVSVTLRC